MLSGVAESEGVELKFGFVDDVTRAESGVVEAAFDVGFAAGVLVAVGNESERSERMLARDVVFGKLVALRLGDDGLFRVEDVMIEELKLHVMQDDEVTRA